MTALQKLIKYGALAFAAVLVVSILYAAVSVFGFLSQDGALLEENAIYEFREDYHTLDIDLAAVSLELRVGDAFSLDTNYSYLKIEKKDGVLHIYDDLPPVHPTNFADVKVLLVIPKDYVFQKASIETGAGVLHIQALSAKHLDMTLGPGEVTIDRLVAAETASIEGGAGEITIHSGQLQNLDLDMGVGQLNLTAHLTGKCSVEQGVGEINLTLKGEKADYTLSVNKGLGDIRIAGSSVSNGSVVGSGDTRVDIEGGIGAIDITFEE